MVIYDPIYTELTFRILAPTGIGVEKLPNTYY
jgi:hypothetical protein